MWCRLLLLMSLFAARRGALAQRGCRRESTVVIGAEAAAGSGAAATAGFGVAVAAIAVASTADGGDVFQRLLRHVAWHVASDGGMAGAHP